MLEGWTALGTSFTTFYTNSFIVAVFAVIGNLMACSLTAYAFARLLVVERSFFGQLLPVFAAAHSERFKVKDLAQVLERTREGR